MVAAPAAARRSEGCLALCCCPQPSAPQLPSTPRQPSPVARLIPPCTPGAPAHQVQRHRVRHDRHAPHPRQGGRRDHRGGWAAGAAGHPRGGRCTGGRLYLRSWCRCSACMGSAAEAAGAMLLLASPLGSCHGPVPGGERRVVHVGRGCAVAEREWAAEQDEGGCCLGLVLGVCLELTALEV